MNRLLRNGRGISRNEMIAKSKQEGIERGIGKGIKMMILNMHKLGINIELIAKAAKVEVAYVEKIIKESGN